MRTLTAPTRPPASHFREGADPEVLREIAREDINLALWRREILPGWRDAFEAILRARDPLALDLKTPGEAVLFAELRRLLGPGAASSLQLLADDMAELVRIFLDLSGKRHCRLRLTRIEDDGCALFHADTLALRLLCTYHGEGTQWLEDSNVRRGELGAQGRSIPAANAAIVIDPAAIRSLSPGDVAVFKGRLCPGAKPLVHRSAPLRHAFDHRIFLCLDLPEACAC